MRLDEPEAIVMARRVPADRRDTALTEIRTGEADATVRADPGAVRCGTTGTLPRPVGRAATTAAHVHARRG